jgi:hypothetical protein
MLEYEINSIRWADAVTARSWWPNRQDMEELI